MNCTKSFRRVNLDLLNRGESAYASPLWKFAHLPSFWHRMSPGEKKVVMTVVETNNNDISVACMKAMHQECNLLYSQMNDLRVCIIISRAHPEFLDFDIDATNNNNAGELIDSVGVVTATTAKLNDGLD